MVNQLAPICLFSYNRINETKETIEALKCNYLASESILYIFSDGPKNISDKNNVLLVREYIKTITGFKELRIIESEENKGLANSVINGVSLVLDSFDKIIVLEDDLVTTPNFLNFMNDSLIYYKNNSNIQSINGFSLTVPKLTIYDTYFQKRTLSWGWATWKERWQKEVFNKEYIRTLVNDNPNIIKKFEYECGNDAGKMLMNSLGYIIDSWYILWSFDHFIKNKYSVYPYLSKVTNIGYGKESTHCKWINTYRSTEDTKYSKTFLFSDFDYPSKISQYYFLRYFKNIYKFNYRIKLVLKKGGLNIVFKELVGRFFNVK